MQQAICSETDEGISLTNPTHLNDYLVILKRRHWVIFATFVAVVLAVCLFSYSIQTMYAAKVQIIIEKQPFYLDHISDTVTYENRDKDFYLTQYNLLRSRELAQSVINQTDLWSELGYAPSKHEAQKSLAIDQYLRRLTITPVQGSRLVNIGYTSPSAQSAAKVANAHANEFINHNVKSQRVVSQKALDWIKDQLEEQKNRVSDSQQKIHQYNRGQDISSLESSRTIVQAKLLEVNTALTDIRTKRIGKQHLVEQLKRRSIEKGGLFTIPEIANDPIVESLRKEIISFKTKRLEMANTFGNKHPKMLQLNSSIRQLNREIEIEVNRISKSIEADLDRILAIESSISAAADQLKLETLDMSEKTSNYDILKHELESNRQLYDILLKQAKGISLTGAMENNSIRVIDKAEAPLSPVRPKTYLNIIVGVVLGGFLGMGLAFFVEYMDNTITTTGQIEKYLGIPTLASISYKKHTKPGIPMLDGEYGEGPPKMIVYQPSDTPDLSGRLLNLLQLPFRDRDGQVLVVESAAKGEGKSTVVTNLAVDFAKAGLRTVMLDCNTGNPSLHAAFDMEITDGLTESMERIFYHKFVNGGLNEYSVDDLFFSAKLRRFTGLLYVSNSPHSSFHDLMIDLKRRHSSFKLTNESKVMRISFSKGRPLYIENQESPLTSRLGKVLLNGGFITGGQFNDAIERHKRTGMNFGYILINSGYVSEEKLHGPLKLQMEEDLHKLFSWKQGTFSFKNAKNHVIDSNRVYFDADFSSLIRHLGEMTGSIYFRDNLFSCLQSVYEPHLYLINPGALSAKRPGPMNTIILSKYLEILKLYFDVVLIDPPPLLEAAESSSIAAFADAVLMVVQTGKVTVKNLQKAKSYLDESKCKTIGALLNQVKKNHG